MRAFCIAVALALSPFLVAPPAVAQTPAHEEAVDFYVLGGLLRGREEFTWTASSGFIYRPKNSRWGIGFLYTNDGHLTNNHRDGFAAQGWYVQPLDNGLELQVGAGPYVSMNNTTIGGVRLNQFRTGLFTSVALKWHVLGNGWYLRSQFNGTLVPRSFDTAALLFGVGYDFPPPGANPAVRSLQADVSVWGGTSRTTQLGTQDSAAAFQLEAQYLPDRPEQWWIPSAYSVAYLSEGDTNLVHRQGVPLQAWWRTPPERFTFSFGMGPYLANDTYRDQSVGLLGILSVRIALELFDTDRFMFESGFMYTRVASFYNKDQDIFMLGLRLYEKR